MIYHDIIYHDITYHDISDHPPGPSQPEAVLGPVLNDDDAGDDDNSMAIKANAGKTNGKADGRGGKDDC